MRAIATPGLDLIKHFESCQLQAYCDEVGVWTIGWGHTGLTHKDGSVHSGRVITQQQADDLLVYDMDVFCKNVEQQITATINQNQFDALVSFDFNTGGLYGSTLRKLINSNLHYRAAEEFHRWDHADGQVLAGLTRRRLSERNLFCSFPDPIILSL